MNIAINPGASCVSVGSWEQAYENIKQFIKDSEVELNIISSKFIPDEGRYLFVLGSDKYNYHTEVEMPGIPLEQIRYIDNAKQNIWDFPRLYVDGASWVWKFGLITRERLIEHCESLMELDKDEIKELQQAIDELYNR